MQCLVGLANAGYRLFYFVVDSRRLVSAAHGVCGQGGDDKARANLIDANVIFTHFQRN